LAPLVDNEIASPLVTLASGSIAATCATVSKQPLLRIKWIRQVNELHGKQVGYITQLRRIAVSEGFFGLWRGTGVSVLRNIPHASLVYTFYPQFERKTGEYFDRRGVVRVISGTLAASSVTLLTHPLDTMRVRISTQAAGQIRYPSILTTVKNVYGSEGLVAFYRGLWPTILGAGPRGGIAFGVFETLKAVSLTPELPYSELSQPSDQTAQPSYSISEEDIIQKLVFGGIAGCVANISVYPLDTIRRRLQTFGWNRKLGEMEVSLGTKMRIQNTKGVFRTFQDIVRVEGYRGLYKGAGLTMIKSPIAAGISFCVNDTVKSYIT